jgi:hypothetical protein
MKRFSLACMAALLAASPSAAEACSPVPNYRAPTPAQLDRGIRNRFRRAAAVVEMVAETRSFPDRPGRMRVLRVYKGPFRAGTRLAVHSISGSMCGRGDYPAGIRGIMVIDRLRGPFAFDGFLVPSELAALRAGGLLPRR